MRYFIELGELSKWLKANKLCLNVNKRPDSLIAPLSKNTWSMIQSPMEFNEHPMTLI